MAAMLPSDLYYADQDLRRILERTKRIAIVGVSAKETRPSWFVANYLNRKGYQIVPVNPAYEGEKLFGATCVASLSDIEGEVEMVDIFRRSEDALGVVEEAMSALSDQGLQTIWMQLGVINEEAAALAERAGLTVIMNMLVWICRLLSGQMKKDHLLKALMP